MMLNEHFTVSIKSTLHYYMCTCKLPDLEVFLDFFNFFYLRSIIKLFQNNLKSIETVFSP